MRIIHRPHTDPYFNIAAEEYLLKNVLEDCFMLWCNEPSIIVGKHQNTLAEINYPWVRKHNIPVIRRISGGGTVFHDPGNLNFTFIAGGDRDKLVDFRKFMQPIIDVLLGLGLPARFEGKNDIRINGFKVSGNAEHVYKNRVLHHGTLLVNAQLNKLNEAIRVDGKNYSDKAVQSIRSEVANISALLSGDLSIASLTKLIFDHVQTVFPGTCFSALSQREINDIQQLANDKYKTWEWNFGYSPNYTFLNEKEIKGDLWKLEMRVESGLIKAVQLTKNGKTATVSQKVMTLLNGKKHNFVEINEIIRKTDIPAELLTNLLF